MTVPATPGNPGTPQQAPGAVPPFAPVPPAGPGVVPPFAAPPTQRDAKKLWIGLGAGALVMVLCCVGGLVGFGILLAGNVRETQFDARMLVTDYLGALKDQRYTAAYRLLCTDLTRRESAQNFGKQMRLDPVIGFTVDKNVTSAPDTSYDLSVTASVTYTEQGVRQRTYVIRNAAGGMTICGER